MFLNLSLGSSLDYSSTSSCLPAGSGPRRPGEEFPFSESGTHPSGETLVEGDAEEDVEGEGDAEGGDEVIAGIGFGERDADGGGGGDVTGAGGEDAEKNATAVGKSAKHAGGDAENGGEQGHHNGEDDEERTGLFEITEAPGSGHAHSDHEEGENAFERIEE